MSNSPETTSAPNALGDRFYRSAEDAKETTACEVISRAASIVARELGEFIDSGDAPPVETLTRWRDGLRGSGAVVASAPSIERLRALEKKWRDESDHRQQSAGEMENDEPQDAAWNSGIAGGLDECADELAALIAELGHDVGAIAFERTPMIEGRLGGQEVAFRMDAYYYGFAPTGIAIIDNILSAVACAGKAYHSTECWNEESGPWHDRLRGNSPAEWIQNAANDASSALRKLTSPAHTSEARDAGETCQFFASGPDGSFFAKTLADAENLIDFASFDRDEWTVTDLHNPTGDAAMRQEAE